MAVWCQNIALLRYKKVLFVGRVEESIGRRHQDRIGSFCWSTVIQGGHAQIAGESAPQRKKSAGRVEAAKRSRFIRWQGLTLRPVGDPGLHSTRAAVLVSKANVTVNTSCRRRL